MYLREYYTGKSPKPVILPSHEMINGLQIILKPSDKLGIMLNILEPKRIKIKLTFLRVIWIPGQSIMEVL